MSNIQRVKNRFRFYLTQKKKEEKPPRINPSPIVPNSNIQK